MNELVERLKSIHLGNERSIWVRQPVSPGSASTLVVFLDGELYRDHIRAVEVIDDGLARQQIADSWFVFVSMANEEARWRECPCYAPFAAFIVEELLPWLIKHHPPLAAVRQRVLVGASYTGLAAAFVVKQCPGVFERVISQSGSFWWNDCWLVQSYATLTSSLPTEFYLDVGSGETQTNVRHRPGVLQKVSQIGGVQRFRDIARQRGHTVKFTEFDGGHNAVEWRNGLPAALRWALPALEGTHRG